MSENGKGDTYRKVNYEKWSENYDYIFRRKEEENEKPKEENKPQQEEEKKNDIGEGI